MDKLSEMKKALDDVKTKLNELEVLKETEKEKYQKHCYLRRIVILNEYKEILELQIEFFNKPTYESTTGY